MSKIFISTSTVAKATLNKNVQTTYDLCLSAINKKKFLVSSLKSSDNPQTVKIVDETEAEIAILQCVLDSLAGDHTSLRIEAR